jgi:hypothetical protein
MHVQTGAPLASVEHVALPPQPPLLTVHTPTQGSEPLALVKPALHVHVTLLPTAEHAALVPQPPLLSEHTGTHVPEPSLV